jgi:hypothetical protein
LPRSPLITSAVNDLAKYFQATTEAAFIDRTWDINTVTSDKSNREGTVSEDESTRIESFGKIVGRSLSYTTGTPVAVRISDLLNGAVCVGEFLKEIGASGLPDEYKKQLQLYALDPAVPTDGKVKIVPADATVVRDSPNTDYDSKASGAASQHPNVNLYAVNVLNPFMGPMTKDVGALEVFMNGIPTLEFSRCVPYLSIDVISLTRTAGTVAPPLTLIGFLNPPALGSSDRSILSAQGTMVSSEAMRLGPGIRSGMELFTAPQTLTNLGATGPTFVPVIDRMQPLASLGNLSISTKIQGGTMSFTTGRLEITIHDRSRLREVATFVRPDLYGTTFLDITYGWSHPEGGINSRNAFGKFLDALKVSTRFRIAGSTFSFEEGGQIKVTLNIQTVGSTDLLYLGPKTVSLAAKEVQKIIRRINTLLAEQRSKFPAPSMADYDFLSAFQDPSSALTASLDKDVIQKVRKLIDKLGTSDPIVSELMQLVGSNFDENSAKPAERSQIGALQNELSKDYKDLLERAPDFGEPNGVLTDFGSEMDVKRFNAMHDPNVVYKNPDSGVTETAGASAAGVAVTEGITRKDYVSYGSVFMQMIAQPIKDSGQYDEVQVVFYPFNKFAGAVHGLPVSAFPIERTRFMSAVDDFARRTPSISCRQLIGLLRDRFTGFVPSRPYLMAGFYNQGKIKEGTVEEADLKKVNISFSDPSGKSKTKKVSKTVVANSQLTLETRLESVGIPEKRFVMPRVEVAVEGAPLTDSRGEIIRDDRGNPKSIIKIHVYDAAMDPHSTLSDIVRAAKDNELGIITIPVANLNAEQRSTGSPTNEVNATLREAAEKAIKAGKDAGLLEEVTLSSLEQVDRSVAPTLAQMQKDNTFYRVKGGYDEIKRLVMAGMPYIVYGTSTTAITNAALSSNTSAGLGNVQLLRAFTEPGETRAESLDSGVPMQVVPSQLSISTIGCPLFSPMQRLFIDFGTGTSIDNVYHVISVDSTIGRDGFKTEVKLGFADAFAQYRSLNQNLALLALNMQQGTSNPPGTPPTATIGANAALPASQTLVAGRSPERLEKDLRRTIRQAAVATIGPLAQLEATERAKLEKKLQDAAAKVAAKFEAEKQKVVKAAEAIIPEDVKSKAAEVQRRIEEATAAAQAQAEPIVQNALYLQQLAEIIQLADTLPASAGAVIISEVAAAVQESRARAAENSRSTT